MDLISLLSSLLLAVFCQASGAPDGPAQISISIWRLGSLSRNLQSCIRMALSCQVLQLIRNSALNMSQMISGRPRKETDACQNGMQCRQAEGSGMEMSAVV